MEIKLENDFTAEWEKKTFNYSIYILEMEQQEVQTHLSWSILVLSRYQNTDFDTICILNVFQYRYLDKMLKQHDMTATG